MYSFQRGVSLADTGMYASRSRGMFAHVTHPNEPYSGSRGKVAHAAVANEPYGS